MSFMSNIYFPLNYLARLASFNSFYPNGCRIPSTTPPNTGASESKKPQLTPPPSRYESQKFRDWNTFLQYLKNHKPPLTLTRCNGAHVIEFLKYLDQFGKTKVHVTTRCMYFGNPNPPAPCTCLLKQAWGSLDALIGRLRATYEENERRQESNPFGARSVRIYLREVREIQATARRRPYEKKKRKNSAKVTAATVSIMSSSVPGSGGGAGEVSSGGVSVGGGSFVSPASTVS